MITLLYIGWNVLFYLLCDRFILSLSTI